MWLSGSPSHQKVILLSKRIHLYLNICEILTHKWFSGSLQSVEIWVEVFFILLKQKMKEIYIKQTLEDFSGAVWFLCIGTYIGSIFSALSRGESWDSGSLTSVDNMNSFLQLKNLENFTASQCKGRGRGVNRQLWICFSCSLAVEHGRLFYLKMEIIIFQVVMRITEGTFKHSINVDIERGQLI